jgi:hypothetical protein
MLYPTTALRGHPPLRAARANLAPSTVSANPGGFILPE